MAAGEVALITSVDEYLGPATARALAADGFRVVGHSMRFGVERARAEFEAAHTNCHAAHSLDPEAAVLEALDRFGRLDAAMSNQLPMELVDGEVRRVAGGDFGKMVEILLVRPERFIAAALQHMIAAGGGRILVVTSGAATRFPHVPPGGCGYSAARAGANALARCLAVKHARDNVQINVVAPFYLYLPWRFPAGPDGAEYRDMLKEKVPMGRFGLPEEGAALAAFLLSGKSPFTTGQLIAFSGAGA